MRLVVLDAETFYSKDYSLSKLSTAAYIRDAQFKDHGWALKDGDDPARWLTPEQFDEWAATVDWSDTAVIGHNCVDGETEVLTRTGWVRFDEYGGQQIVQVDAATQGASFVSPSAVVRKQYTGRVLEWNTLYHRGLYTPEHRMVVATADKPAYWFEGADKVSARSQNNTYLPVACSLGGVSNITPDEARLIEAVRADGHIAQRGNSVRFRLTKQRKISRIVGLCATVGVRVSVSKKSDGATDIALLAHPLRDRIVAMLGTGKDKSLGPWVLDLSSDAKLALLDEASFWDGCVASGTKSSFHIASAKRSDMEWLQTLAHTTMCSMSFSVRGNARGFNKANTGALLYQGTIRGAGRAKLVDRPEEKQFSGTVYCVTVPTGAFLVRRRGAIWVTGNCIFDGSILAWRKKISPALWIDTLGMSRAVIGPVLKSFGLDSVGEHLGFGGKLDKGRALKDVMGVRHPDPDQMTRLAFYAIEDAELTYKIFQHCAQKFPGNLHGAQDELGEYEILDWTIRCYTEPSVAIDEKVVQQAYAAEGIRRERLLASAGVSLAELRSDIKFAQLLDKLGVPPPRKISKRTGKETWAFAKTDEAMVALLEDEDPAVRAVVEARMGVKTSIVQTRLMSLAQHAATNKKRFSVGIGYSGAHTHRFSAVSGGRKGGLNILNFPREGDLNKTLVAPPGWLIVNADSSQIEARLAMWQSGEEGILSVFRDKKDPYSTFASHVYGRPINKKDHPGERFVGKVGCLSLQYGSSHLAFQNMVRIQGRANGLPKEMWSLDEDFCKQVVQTYRRTYPGVPKLWRSLETALAHMADGQTPPQVVKAVELTKTGYVLPSGLEVNYHDLRARREEGKRGVQFDYHRENKQFSSSRNRLYGAMMLENICQSLARETIVADQLVTINRELRVVWQVYDSIVCLIPEAHKDEFCGWIEDVMNTRPSWSLDDPIELPIACEVGVGKTYAEAKKSEWKRPDHMRKGAAA